MTKDFSMSEEIKHNRRRFLGTAAVTLAGMFRSADAESRKAELAYAPAWSTVSQAFRSAKAFGPLGQARSLVRSRRTGTLPQGCTEGGSLPTRRRTLRA